MTDGMPTSLRRLVLAVVGVGCVACGGREGDERSVRTDSAGLTIVRATPNDVPLAWTFDSLFTLGGADSGPQAFYQLRGGVVGVDAAGEIFVLDTDAKRIVVFDSTGAFVRSMGAPGGGPGELQWPIALVVLPDGAAAAFDIGKGGLVWFDAQGNTGEQVPLRGWYNGGTISATADALYLANRDFGDDAAEAGSEQLVRLSAADTIPLASFPRPSAGVVQLKSCGMSFRGMPPVFTPSLRWGAHGDRVAVAGGVGYELLLLAGTDTVGIVRRPLETEAASREAAAEEIGERFRVATSEGVRVCKADEVVEQLGYAERIPIIAEVAAGPEGTWWVQRRNRGGADVFAADGSYLGTLPGSAPFPVLVLPGRRVARIAADEMDVERLVVYRVVGMPD